MSDGEPIEGWSIVRHRAKDEVGSDADSVEVISEESDRDTDRENCDEGKDDGGPSVDTDRTVSSASADTERSGSSASPDSTSPPEPAADRTNPDPEAGADGSSSDRPERPRARQREPDLVGLITKHVLDKMQQIYRARNGGRSLSRDELRIRLIIILSALLALLCSLLTTTYLVFIKLHFPRSTSSSFGEYRTCYSLIELEEVLSKLQKARLGDEQHHEDYISAKLPADFRGREWMIITDDDPPTQRSSYTVPTPDDIGETVASSGRVIGGEAVPNLDIGRDKSASDWKGGNQIRIQIPLENGQDDIKTSYCDESRQDPLKQETGSQQEKERHSPNFLNPSNLQNKAANESTRDNSTKLPNKNTNSSNQMPLIENTLLDVRKVIISIQKDIYSQIMNNLLEYKIDLYKNLLRAGSDISFSEQNKKANHKNFMLIRGLQQMIAKSSESNFESWYKFYSDSVFPKIREVVGKIDSITKGFEGQFESRHQQGEHWGDDLNDDFFIRAGDPLVEPVTGGTVDKEGFDWKNLDKKIRENMRYALKHGRPTNSESDGYIVHEKRRGDGGKHPNLVEIGKDFVYKKDKHDSNNLKGDFRKRKAGEHEHKKRKTQDFDHKLQNHWQAEHEHFKRSHLYEDEEHNRADKNHEGNNHDKKQDKREEHRYGKKELEREKQERDGKKNKHEYEQSNYENRDKKYEHEGTGENDRHEHVDANKKYMKNQEESYKGDSKNKADKYDDNRYAEQDSKSKQDKHKQSDYKEYQDFGGKYRDKKHRKKISFSDVGKYVKSTVAGLWKTVKGGLKNVKDYSKSFISRKSKDIEKHEEWSKEFVKEMKDVIRVLGGNPTVAKLSEVQKSVVKFFEDGLGSIMGSFSDEWDEKSEMGPEGLHPGPEGMNEQAYDDDSQCEEVNADEGCSEESSDGYPADEGYESDDQKSEPTYTDAPNYQGTEAAGEKTSSWYIDTAKHRANARRNPHYPRVSDSSWFLGLGRHRAYLRRKGIHLDDDGSWFVSSAKHRAKMRQQHIENPDSPYFYSQASKR